MDFTFIPSEFDALLLLGLENHRKQGSVVLVNHFVAVRVASVDQLSFKVVRHLSEP